MKLTLLELVQTILSSLDGDEVDSISDTTESRQVAQIVKTAYFNILARADLPEHKQLFTLDPSTDGDLPVVMSRPEHVSSVEWIKYDIAEISEPIRFEYVNIVPLEQFLDIVHRLDSSASNVDTFTIDDMEFLFENDRAPTYCTVLHDSTIIFNSFNEGVDSTLQSTKTLCYGNIVPVFELSNSYVPNIDERQFTLLLNEAKALAFLELKQIVHDQAISESRRQWRETQKSKALVKFSDFDQFPDFSRKAGRWGRRVRNV